MEKNTRPQNERGTVSVPPPPHIILGRPGLPRLLVRGGVEVRAAVGAPGHAEGDQLPPALVPPQQPRVPHQHQDGLRSRHGHVEAPPALHEAQAVLQVHLRDRTEGRLARTSSGVCCGVCRYLGMCVCLFVYT